MDEKTIKQLKKNLRWYTFWKWLCLTSSLYCIGFAFHTAWYYPNHLFSVILWWAVSALNFSSTKDAMLKQLAIKTILRGEQNGASIQSK